MDQISFSFDENKFYTFNLIGFAPEILDNTYANPIIYDIARSCNFSNLQDVNAS